MNYCHVCRGAGSLRLQLKGEVAFFQCYRCDGEGYIAYPYETDDKSYSQSEEYTYNPDIDYDKTDY